MATQLPFTLLTGYLGSGKTTLLNRLLRDTRLSNSLIIINELAELPLDGMKLTDVDIEYVVLNSGCVCCTMHADLTSTVAKALFRRQHGLLPPFERFVLETTGVADPYALIAAFGNRGGLSHLCYLDMVIATVDGLLGEKQLMDHAEVRAHVQAADHVVLTKTDLICGASDVLFQRLQSLNSLATISLSPSEVDLGEIVSSGLRDPLTGEANWQKWLRIQGNAHHSPHYFTGSTDNPTHSHYEDTIQTRSIVLEQPVDFRKWCNWVALYIQRYGKRFLRLKAILHTNEFSGPIAFDTVREIVHAPIELSSQVVPDRKSRIVIMCQDVAPLELRLIEASVRDTQVTGK